MDGGRSRQNTFCGGKLSGVLAHHFSHHIHDSFVELILVFFSCSLGFVDKPADIYALGALWQHIRQGGLNLLVSYFYRHQRIRWVKFYSFREQKIFS
jgi:hypothetical protein